MGPERLTAVLVDDEELARKYLRELLAAHPEISLAAECANGFEAVKAVAELKPDLLFLDVQMPKLNGFEVCTRLKADEATRDICVFILTGNDEDDVRAYAFEAGADYFFAKAWGTRALAQMLADVMSR
jgi:two-component system LytT family response regulator